ncbi:hypothetical protein GCM10020260_26030 [Nesterenkonia halobia]|uniref:UDP-N-acetylglucosamine kinase n=2 Tax=Nesterenkonia halobia TaxID=37922 RepID=A0ABP6RF66_9MICC
MNYGVNRTLSRPAQLKDHEARTGEQFHPMEMASLVHEESSMIARTMRTEAINNGENIIVDTVLSSADSAKELGATLHEAGYQVEVIDVEVPFDVSSQRIEQRWHQARQHAEASPGSLGGRWVPSEYARAVYDGPDGMTKPEHAARQLAESCPAVMRYRIHRTRSQAHGLRGGWEVDQSRMRPGSALVPTETAEVQARVRANRPVRTHRPDAGVERCDW